MLVSYENRKTKFLVNFSSPRLRRMKASNFTFGEVQYRARFETGDSIAVKPRNWRSCIDVTALLSPASRLAWYCTQPEMKFHAFMFLKRGEEKLITKGDLFFDFHTRTTLTFDQTNKNNLYT